MIFVDKGLLYNVYFVWCSYLAAEVISQTLKHQVEPQGYLNIGIGSSTRLIIKNLSSNLIFKFHVRIIQ
jgi:hypothetical protein